MIRALAFLMALASTVSASFVPALAQEVKPPAVAIVLRPAAAPTPALKYRLLPEHDTMVPGNAAVFYHRAIEMFQERSQRTAPNKPQGKSTVADEQAVADWITGPLLSIPRDQARQTLDAYRAALHETRLAGRRQTCNWEFDSRQEGVGLLIPEIQQMRSLARLVALQARIAVLDRKTDEAIEWLQTGYAMSRHISQGPFLIQGMVGMALTAVMARPLEDLIQAPGTPSLYWALADRPHPFIDLSAAFEGERLLLEREIPQLRELDTGPWSLERGRMFAEELARQAVQAGQDRGAVAFGFGIARVASLVPPRRIGSAGGPGLSRGQARLDRPGSTPCASRGDAGRPGRRAAQFPVVPAVARRCLQMDKPSLLPGIQRQGRGNDRPQNSRPDAMSLLRLFTMMVPAISVGTDGAATG